jgi:hypothetical protein
MSITFFGLFRRHEIRIRDNGNGVPETIRDQMFIPFFTTKPAGMGSGLDLSISYDIVVRQHGGEIRLESEEGKYAEFIVTLSRGWRPAARRRVNDRRPGRHHPYNRYAQPNRRSESTRGSTILLCASFPFQVQFKGVAQAPPLVGCATRQSVRSEHISENEAQL